MQTAEKKKDIWTVGFLASWSEISMVAGYSGIITHVWCAFWCLHPVPVATPIKNLMIHQVGISTLLLWSIVGSLYGVNNHFKCLYLLSHLLSHLKNILKSHKIIKVHHRIKFYGSQICDFTYILTKEKCK